MLLWTMGLGRDGRPEKAMIPLAVGVGWTAAVLAAPLFLLAWLNLVKCVLFINYTLDKL